MKGVILAGGSGTRLSPLTTSLNKHLLPIFDKPMIYYPLTTLISSGIDEIIIVTNPESVLNIKKLLGDGGRFGIKLEYAIQESANGIPGAMMLAESFVCNENFTLILGDNLLLGQGLGGMLFRAGFSENSVNKFYAYPVRDPWNYGVVLLNHENMIEEIVEKPLNHISNLAIPGIYHFGPNAFNFAKSLKLSKRNEYEITDLLKLCIKYEGMECQILNRGTAWLDTGTVEGLANATEYVRVMQSRLNFLVGSPEEAAWRIGFISTSKLNSYAKTIENTEYGKNLMNITKIQSNGN